ncbi:MAG TPA: L-aspartate oxidase [Acidimicrobiia bacterium]|jgi:L-aspartate oxidase
MVTRRLDNPLVIGSGVAGLSVALGLPASAVLTSGEVGSTWWAQGGIAAAVAADDNPGIHARDTLAVSGGLGVKRAVEALTEGGAAAIRRLVELGARFDRTDGGDLALSREAGHSLRRVLHADGDATGREVMRTLTAAVAARPSIEVLANWRALDLVRSDGQIEGVVAATDSGDRLVLLAPAVILATGGIGRVYRYTTNPPGVTGEGIAMAARAGARLADLEFVQFHPTALRAATDPLPLLTEALRGEGALLVDEEGRRFMPYHHPDAELAPRDVVARAIFWQWDRQAGAYLDLRSIEALAEHFPTVFAAATAAGFDPAVEVLPVTPAAHYYMGGVDTDADGRTSLPGLWVVGEAASSGVHGANRLASNSLLEGLVFGARVATDVASNSIDPSGNGEAPAAAFDLPLDSGAVEEVRDLMWDRVGVVRTGAGLWEAHQRLLDFHLQLSAGLDGRTADDVARMVVAAALRRSESRGGHYRADYPEPDSFQASRTLVEPSPVASVRVG